MRRKMRRRRIIPPPSPPPWLPRRRWRWWRWWWWRRKKRRRRRRMWKKWEQEDLLSSSSTEGEEENISLPSFPPPQLPRRGDRGGQGGGWGWGGRGQGEGGGEYSLREVIIDDLLVKFVIIYYEPSRCDCMVWLVGICPCSSSWPRHVNCLIITPSQILSCCILSRRRCCYV